MENVEKINFDTFLDYFEEANVNGYRIRMSDPEKWKQFHYINNINRSSVDKIIGMLPSCKVTIIGQGAGKGLYVYSWNTEEPSSNVCFKYKP